MNADLVNGLFELLGAAVLWANVVRVRKDKHVKGMNPWTTVFFSAWGFWNLYYYPSLDQWLSFYGGIAIVAVNTIWLGHVVYYYYRQHVKYARKVSRTTYDIFNGFGDVIGVCTFSSRDDCWKLSYKCTKTGESILVGATVAKQLLQDEGIKVLG